MVKADENKKTDERKPIDKIIEDVNALEDEEILDRIASLENRIQLMKSEMNLSKHKFSRFRLMLNFNSDRVTGLIKPPFLVGTVQQIWNYDELDHDGIYNKNDRKSNKSATIFTTKRILIFIEDIGILTDIDLKPGDTVCVNKDRYSLIQILPKDFDIRVKAMEVVDKPSERFSEIGGLDNQIQEMVEVLVLPFKYKEKFDVLRIRPHKGVLLYGSPGSGKTLLARACAAETNSTFLKLSGTMLVQNYIGEGARLVREAFDLAKFKAPCIIFIDEIDAIGSKRFNSEKSGDREVHRTLLELLNQLDGFSTSDDIKVVGATNRIDILDPALLRSGRMDRKIELQDPDIISREQILNIHSRRMILGNNVDISSIAKSTDGFSAAMCRAVCVEAAMIALRRNSTCVEHEDFLQGVNEVQGRKNGNLFYYS